MADILNTTSVIFVLISVGLFVWAVWIMVKAITKHVDRE